MNCKKKILSTTLSLIMATTITLSTMSISTKAATTDIPDVILQGETIQGEVTSHKNVTYQNKYAGKIAIEIVDGNKDAVLCVKAGRWNTIASGYGRIVTDLKADTYIITADKDCTVQVTNLDYTTKVSTDRSLDVISLTNASSKIYKLDLTKQLTNLDTTTSPLNNISQDTTLTLYNENYEVLEFNDDISGSNIFSQVSKDLPLGTFYLKVSHKNSLEGINTHLNIDLNLR